MTDPDASADTSETGCESLPELLCSAHNYQPADSVGYLMRRILSLFRQAVERELGGTGLTHAQWVPLLKLHQGLASTVAELARVCELDAGSMTRLLDRLEAKHLCRRVRSETDRRVVHIELTEAGCATARDIPAILSRVQSAYLAGFTVEEWQHLKSDLSRILDTALALHAGAEHNDAQHS